MNLTGKLRTPYFPSDKYPEHWGPFELHTMVPYDTGLSLRPLEVAHYQIVMEYKPTNKSIIVGFDDFAPAWPVDQAFSDKALQRRDRYREMAQFRALVQIKKLKYLSAEGVEQLRDAGADVSEEACRQGLWIAVYGKYYNYPRYDPGKNAKQLIQVQAIHQGESQIERRLHITSMDPRTAVRSFLYFERIKLVRFIEHVSREDDGRTDIRDRSIEWFVKKMMEMFPTDETSIPEKRDNYRGARRHTSEARHVFVCHAEWLFTQTTIYQGAEKHMSKKVLKGWADLAPRMREIAATEGRAGWGVWDAVWDKEDFTGRYKKNKYKLKYYLKVIDSEKSQDKSTPSSSRSGRSLGRPNRVDKGKGRATTVDEEQYTYRWIPDPLSDEDDGGISLDEAEQADRAKRPRMASSQDGGPSRTQQTRSSPSLGDQDDRISSSLTRDHYQPSPSMGTRTPSSIRNFATTSQIRGSARESLPRTPSSSGRNPSSSWRFTSQKGPSITPATSHTSLGAKSLNPPAQARTPPPPPPPPQASNVIYISSDDEFSGLTADVARSSIAPKNEVIDITDSPSEARDESMRAVSEMGDLEDLDDTPMQAYDDDEPAYPRQRTSVLRETVIAETPPRENRPQPSSGRLESPQVEEEISDSQEDYNSSDSESKYGPPAPRPLSPKRQKLERLRALNEQIISFAPHVVSTVYAPHTWKPWVCDYPSQRLKPGSDPNLARTILCSFKIDLKDPSLAVQRLLNDDPKDSEFLKHLQTKPCVFKGPTDELAVEIFQRVVELHREEHYRDWGVRQVITDNGAGPRAHFVPLDDSED
ncbi:unnamed protein product [Rhizoctonia solani]|uniref:Uncharacterized protein n=1 Tax=Rhizoctonia solani TaxID=456999 RepID=A0A8H3DV25_9AGAM|nr:unnamed protein product [Rhizoctonia solani]